MILLLAGTTEARKMGWLLADYGVAAVATLAGETKAPADMGIAVETGGFGGEDGFRAFLAQRGITGVIDATHPFAVRITERTYRICTELGLPYMQLMRPHWEPEPDDTWFMVDDMAQVADFIPQGARVLVAAGRKAAEDLSLPGREVFVRVIDPQPEKDGVTWIIGRPPFSLAEEVDLLRRHRIDWIIAKNAGGAADGKLLAARQLHLPVVMVNRPPAPVTPCRERVQDVLDWVMDL